jgi:putative tryptophan/tyrosine transport system substrate-binding protein
MSTRRKPPVILAQAGIQSLRKKSWVPAFAGTTGKCGRRTFIAGLGAAAGSSVVWPLAARGQQGAPTRRIGVLVNGVENDSEMRARLIAFRHGLDRLGWAQDRNVRLDYRFAGERPEQFRQFAAELVALKPDVIFANSTPAVVALQRETRTVPIVFAAVSDPIGSGVVASLARPGGNVTGLALYEDGIPGKWLGMLKEIAPWVARAAVVANPKATPFDYFMRSARLTGPSFGIEVVPAPLDKADEIEPSIERFAQQANGALVVLPDAGLIYQRDLIISLALHHRLPAVYPFRIFVTAGGLMSYSTDVVEQFQQAAGYVDSILRGVSPADLPVQTPTKYETVFNLKTAKALGLDVPASLLVRADEVIE